MLFSCALICAISLMVEYSFAKTFSSDELQKFESVFSNLQKVEESINATREDSKDPQDFFSNSAYTRHLRSDRFLPPLWDEVLSLRSGNYPRDRNGKFVVDVWDYKQRMSLYKYLIENVHSCVWSNTDMIERLYEREFITKYDPGNILWGLPLQHGWQFSSGRLLTLPNSTVFTSDSWWGNMNFYLSVIPYLGAVHAGIAPEISFAHNPNSSLFCEQPSDCLDLVIPWTEFFQLVKLFQCDPTTASTPSNKLLFPPPTPISNSMDFNLSYPMEALLSSLWSAHIHSINAALPLFPEQLQSLSVPEQTFAVGWSNLVDLIAESVFPCNMTITNWLQNCLPHRLLQADDTFPPKIPDLTLWENRGVILVDTIYLANEALHGLIEKVWRAMMCTEEGRAVGREMLIWGIYRPVLMVQDTVVLLQMLAKNTANHVTCGI